MSIHMLLNGVCEQEHLKWNNTNEHKHKIPSGFQDKCFPQKPAIDC